MGLNKAISSAKETARTKDNARFEAQGEGDTEKTLRLAAKAKPIKRAGGCWSCSGECRGRGLDRDRLADDFAAGKRPVGVLSGRRDRWRR